MKSKILIIDNEVKLSALLARILEMEGYRVLHAGNAKAGLQIVEREDIRVVLSDVKLPDANGVELVKKIKLLKPYIEVINLTAFGTIGDSVMAIKNGAFDYLTKGDDNERIIPLVNKAAEKASLQYRVNELRLQRETQHGFSVILGNSPAISEAISLAKKVARTEATVLLLGETGTGKDVFAEALHYESLRKDNTFVAVNCSAFNKDLLESELFGYKAGSFTGAGAKDKKGLFEEADGGTIFLDELGEMSHDLQAKLLRVLENGTFIKVGETKTTKVDVRLVAATNRNLQKDTEENHFRLDLYYRLSGFSIELPPLRERTGDIEILARHFIKIYAAKVNKKVPEANESFFKLLKQHKWNGNIRELKNVIERVIILTESPVLTPKLLPYEFHGGYEDLVALDLDSVEKHHIRRILRHTKGNKSEAARILGIGLATLYRKIEEYPHPHKLAILKQG